MIKIACGQTNLTTNSFQITYIYNKITILSRFNNSNSISSESIISQVVILQIQVMVSISVRSKLHFGVDPIEIMVFEKKKLW